MITRISRDGNRYCVSFERKDGRKNNVYLNEEDILALADATTVVAKMIIRKKKDKVQREFDEQIRKYSVFDNNNYPDGMHRIITAFKRALNDF
ncbi:MAG: hypothetical protein KBT03_11020 [Bacteroidales bacterium]|nr:hypothetical protein [Candidatus Scybalousia scybalohippi]